MAQPATAAARRFRLPALPWKDSMSIAAFVMSLSATLLSVYYGLRGSDMAVDPPAQLILYRDGEGEASVLTAAVRLEMINLADGYGDVLKDASISLDGGRTHYDYQGTIRTVLANNSTEKPGCDSGLRCVDLPGLHVIETTDEILDTPAGAARAFNFSFPLVGWNCTGTDKGCSRFEAFEKSAAAVSTKGVAATIKVRFHSDGERTLRCETGALNLDYLRKVGWISVPCKDASA